ncbi:hypothetical protein [Mycolicibacterium wolinskyi]
MNSTPPGDRDDAGHDPDADPEMLQSKRTQPDQAEGADDPEETGSGDDR